jgi:hypothetical protein
MEIKAMPVNGQLNFTINFGQFSMVKNQINMVGWKSWIN